MNTFLWALQIILAIKLLTTSFTHGLRQSMPTMQESIQRMGSLARPLHALVALMTLAGALGLVLPGIIQAQNHASLLQVTPWTAAALVVLLLLSILFHVRSREKPKIFVSLVLAAFALVVAWGRWG